MPLPAPVFMGILSPPPPAPHPLTPLPLALADLEYLCRLGGGSGIESEGGILSEFLIQIYQETLLLRAAQEWCPQGHHLPPFHCDVTENLVAGIT